MNRYFVAVFLMTLPLWCGPYYFMNEGKKIYLTPACSKKDVITTRSSKRWLHFHDSNGRDIVVTDEIIVKFKNAKSLDDYLNQYNVQVEKKYSIGNVYILKASSAEEALNIANELCEMQDVVYAQPNVIRKRELR